MFQNLIATTMTNTLGAASKEGTKGSSILAVFDESFFQRNKGDFLTVFWYGTLCVHGNETVIIAVMYMYMRCKSQNE